jgi:hypothetical protein
MRRTLIVLFMVVCFATIAFANRPPTLAAAVDQRLTETLAPMAVWRIHYAGWLVRRWAHLVGLDNRWQMFGRQSRFNWRYEMVGHYGDAGERLLPVPLQSSRTAFQDLVLDFKEPKLHLNLYSDEPRRERYAQYLCRQFPTLHGAWMEEVVIDLAWRPLRSRAEASRTGDHLEPEEYTEPLDAFPCIWREGVR